MHQSSCRSSMRATARTSQAALLILLGVGGGVGSLGCKGTTGPGSPPTRADEPIGPRDPAPSTTSAGGQSPGTTDPAGPAAETGRVLLWENGKERWMEAQAAVAAGYTLVDLGDDWTPYIFAEQHDEAGQPLHNRYRRVFIGLANDALDSDGQPLEPGGKNYLELYGIFPSFSVLRTRFLEDQSKSCLDPAGQPALEAVETVAYVSPEDTRKVEKRLGRIQKEVEEARRKARVATLADLVAKRPDMEPKVKLLERRAAEKLAMAEVEKRLSCEGLLGHKNGRNHKTGVYDDAMRLAVRHFQQKNMIYEANYLRRKTMDALARPTLDNDHDAVLRALRERVVDAAGVIEDGTTNGRNGPPQYVTESGQREPVRNLAEEYTTSAAAQLGFDTAAGALAFFSRHPAADFSHLRVAVKLAPRPEYYAPHMDLSIVVDRGDVWYDVPFDENDRWQPQPRKRFPSLTLMLRYRNQNIPLSRWRTTVGGWRAEQASNGYEYYRYKGSDVGPRVVRHVTSGPVWIAPASTPIRSLVKGKIINKHWQQVVNYDELGPGYLSAYGVVAGYFVVPGKDGRADFDNGIRAHGSSDYLSIYSQNGFSHGCHRLPNHLAIRMYDFLLRHRTIRVDGDAPMSFSRQFLFKDHVYEMRIPSRGFIFTLEPPLPVNVLEGEIKGNIKKPILEYMPKPGVKYPGPPPPLPNSPEARAGGTGAATPAAAAEDSP
ncbi:MAG: L,D-transpeptidase [Deltaproteobacteria bacterium]|nr:L,D-transpeptidase [Deltaproteobacteria bacterium]